MLDLKEPLSDQEFEELEAFLMSDATGDESMDISTLDGFLTAIVSGPNLIKPSVWLPLVWGQAHPKWQSPAEAEHFMSMVMRQMNTIIDVLMNDPEDFEPVVFTREFEGKTIHIIDEWCAGYVMGMNLDEAGWKPLLDSPDHHHLLATILIYGTEVGFEQRETDPSINEQHDQFVADLNLGIRGIYQYWAEARRAGAQLKTIRHDTPIPGRNDPCPCGSGKKFKKCCGEPSKLH